MTLNLSLYVSLDGGAGSWLVGVLIKFCRCSVKLSDLQSESSVEILKYDSYRYMGYFQGR